MGDPFDLGGEITAQSHLVVGKKGSIIILFLREDKQQRLAFSAKQKYKARATRTEMKEDLNFVLLKMNTWHSSQSAIKMSCPLQSQFKMEQGRVHSAALSKWGIPVFQP